MPEGKPMTAPQLASLNPGDVVQHVTTGDAYTVIEVIAGRAIAVRTRWIDHHREWRIVARANYTPTDREEIG